MIAHIASAGETRGRVLLRVLRDPTEGAVAAALRLARAYDAEIETLVIEDEAVFALCDHPFAREISPTGRRSRQLTAAEVARDYEGLRRRAAQLVETLAAKTVGPETERELPITTRSLRGPPGQMLQVACTENGPWNVVVLGEPADLMTCRELEDLNQSIRDITGIVATGRGRVRSRGATVAVVEDRQQLYSMAQLARRLTEGASEPVIVLPVAEDDDEARRLDGELRLALADMPETTDQIVLGHVEVTHAEPSPLAARLVRLQPSFVIMAASGIIARSAGALSQFIGAVHCPVLLARDR